MRKPTNLPDRLYRLILRVFPFDFRREYGAEMEGVFREERTGMNRTRLWWKTAIGFLRSAPMEHLDVFRRDFRYGLRSLARKPFVSLITFAVLSVGIGANTAVFSAMNMMLLRPLPVPSPEQVVRVISGTQEGAVDYDEYVLFRNQNRTLSQLAAFQDKQVTFRADGAPESLVATTVTGNYFETLRVPALLGRVIEPNDDRTGSAAVVMISEDFWKYRFGRDPAVLGRTVHIDGRPFTVIGISPERFGGADRDVSRDLWLPWNGPQHAQSLKTNMIGRLEAGVSMRQAEADLAVIASQFKDDRSPQYLTMKVREARMVPVVIRGQVVPIFVLFLGLVGVSLMIPCLNIGSLLLVRSSERRREMGIRLALGAGRGQLARQVLTETFVIGLGAGIVGIGMFAGTLVILISRFGFSTDYASRLVLDWRVAGFSLGLSLVTTLMFGFAPAFHSARTEVLVAIKEGGAAGPVARSRVRAGFVIGQVAVSALLLALSGLFVRTLTSPRLADAGFVADGVLLAGINLSTTSGPDVEFYEALIRNLEVSPLVQSANISEANGPLGAGAAKARSSGTAQDAVSYSTYAVSRGHFRTLGVPLLKGRDFNEGDRAGAPRVGIVNESLARKQWPGQSPIGKTISGIEIVGLARNAKYLQNSEVPNPFLYVPLSQNPTPFVTLFVKTSGDPRSVLPQVRDAIARLDPDLPISNVMALESLANLSLSPLRMVATLAAVLGTAALGLAAMGIYGTVAFLTRQRTREIGIRMAMGATASHIVRCVTQQSLRWIVIGLALGLGTAFIVSNALPGMIYGVSGSDPLTYLAVILLLGGTAYTACWIPARRASRTDPLAALREE